MYLHELHETHKLRNTPLIEIKAKYSNLNSAFAEVTPSYGIAKKTYNELGVVWTEGHLWTFDVWDEDRIDNIGSNGNEGLHYEV